MVPVPVSVPVLVMVLLVTSVPLAVRVPFTVEGWLNVKLALGLIVRLSGLNGLALKFEDVPVMITEPSDGWVTTAAVWAFIDMIPLAVMVPPDVILRADTLAAPVLAIVIVLSTDKEEPELRVITPERLFAPLLPTTTGPETLRLELAFIAKEAVPLAVLLLYNTN